MIAHHTERNVHLASEPTLPSILFLDRTFKPHIRRKLSTVTQSCALLAGVWCLLSYLLLLCWPWGPQSWCSTPFWKWKHVQPFRTQDHPWTQVGNDSLCLGHKPTGTKPSYLNKWSIGLLGLLMNWRDSSSCDGNNPVMWQKWIRNSLAVICLFCANAQRHPFQASSVLKFMKPYAHAARSTFSKYCFPFPFQTALVLGAHVTNPDQRSVDYF